jgi:hypothetical protein
MLPELVFRTICHTPSWVVFTYASNRIRRIESALRLHRHLGIGSPKKSPTRLTIQLRRLHRDPISSAPSLFPRSSPRHSHLLWHASPREGRCCLHAPAPGRHHLCARRSAGVRLFVILSRSNAHAQATQHRHLRALGAILDTIPADLVLHL